MESRPTILTPSTTATQLAWAASIQGASGKRRPEQVAVVVISGERQERDDQRRDELGEDVVLGRAGPVGQVAGPEQDVERRCLGVDRRDRRDETSVVVDVQLVEGSTVGAARRDMGVGQLTDEDDAAA